MNPSCEDWEPRLAAIKNPSKADIEFMARAAEEITQRLGGYWSVDFLKDKHGKLWVIDLAEGALSYRNDLEFREVSLQSPKAKPAKGNELDSQGQSLGR